MQRSIPLGYEIKDGKARIHDDEAKMIHFAFDSYCKGDSQFTIAKHFQEAGYKNGNGRVSWSHSTIGKILQLKVYLGDDFYPQLISQELFDNAAEVRNRKAEHQKRYRNDDYEYREPLFAFSAKLFCDICGSTFYRFQVRTHNNARLTQWKCRNFKSHNENGIPRTNVYEAELENIFVSLLHELASDLGPLFKKPAEQTMINSDIKLLDNEISRLLSTPKSASENKEQLNDLIARRAYLQFERATVDDFDYQTGKVKRMIADKNLMDKEFDADFFRGVVDRVTIKESGILCFHFINGFEMYLQYNHEEARKNVKKEC